jgi:integrase
MARPKIEWPKIRERIYPSGKKSWMVDAGVVNGRRIKFMYKLKTQAESKAGLLRVERENEGSSAFGLPRRERVDAEAAANLLRPHGISLKAAAEFYLANLDIVRVSKSVQEVVRELLEIKEQDHRAARYIKDLRNKLEGNFAAAEQFAGRPIHEITAHELEDWLRSLKVEPITRNNYKRVLGVLFAFAVKRRYSLRNPAKETEKASVTPEKPGVLSLQESEALLRAADEEMVAPIALCLFAGLRPEAELWRLDWSNLDIQDKSIDVSKSKNVASHRFIRISDNLVEWLAPVARKRGPVSLHGDSYWTRLQRIRERAATALEQKKTVATNLRSWPQDGLRHTYASMHYAAFKNAADTAEQLGHGGNLRTFFRHYRNRVREVDAKLFWEIRPSASDASLV